MKKIISIVTAILMMASLTTKTFATNDTFTDADLTYTVLDETARTVSVSTAVQTMVTCKIPETITNNGKTYTVTMIADNAFEKCEQLQSISIPDTVVSIGDYAFLNCGQLLAVHIPELVTNIGKNAFSNCRSLTTVNIPKGIEIIKENTFHSCLRLKNITIPEGVKAIGRNAFINCPLTMVVIPSSVEIIQNSAFQSCSYLTTVIVSNTIQTMEKNTFLNANALTNVLVVSNENNKVVNTAIENVISKHPKNPVCYLGLTDINALQSTINSQANKTLNLEPYFTVTSRGIDKQGNETTLPVPIPDQFLQPIYTLTGTIDGNTRIENNQLIIDPIQTHDFSVEGTLNGEKEVILVDITPSPITTIEVKQRPLRVSYIEGESFDPTGLQLKINYENRTSEIVSYDQSTKNNFQFIVSNPLTTSDSKVKIVYGNQAVEQKLTVQRKPNIVSANQNAIIGLANKYVRGKELEVVVKGAGMDRQSPIKGDVRYQPVSWKILKEQKFDEGKYQITMNTKLLEVGTHQIIVTYQKEEFDGQTWVEQETIQQVKSFDVIELIPPTIDPIPEEPTKVPTILPEDKIPTKVPEILPENVVPIKGETPTKAPVVQTGDTTFITAFVTLTIVSATLFRYLKKGTKKVS